MAFRISMEQRGERMVYQLHDDTTGASAAILPSFGFNLFDLRLPAAGELRRVIDAAPRWEEDPRNPGRNGTPVLFPYPNRVRDGRFIFGGREYHLPVTSGPNAIHGFALNVPWDVIEHKATASAASITGRYQISKNSPEMRPLWPADAVLQVKYGLAGRRLSMTITVTNPTDTVLPYGFGIHPYFRLPWGVEGSASATRVLLPASKYWVLKDFLPTGEVLPVTERLDYRSGQPMKTHQLDDVLTGLEFKADRCVCRLVDRTLNAEFRLSFDKSFRALVAYTPPGTGNVISLEPYTQTTDAINLQAQGFDAGLRVLEHGRQDTLFIAMETADL